MCENAEPTTCHTCISSAVETRAKLTARLDNMELSLLRTRTNSSALLRHVALNLSCERIQRLFGQMRLALGGMCAPDFTDWVMEYCPSDSGPVVLGLTTDGIGCSCSPSMPTPCARDYKGRSSRKWLERPGKLATLPDRIGGVPHPSFVEQLMGFPIGWADLEGSETRYCHR
jgi:hypothetical protein